MEVLQANQDCACKRSDPEHFHIVAAPITVCDYGADHLSRNASHFEQLIASVVLDVVPRQRPTTRRGVMSPLLRAVAFHNPLNGRQRYPIWVRASLTKPHENVTMQCPALLCLRAVPQVMADAKGSRYAPLQKVHLDRMHPPLKRKSVLQGMLRESNAAARLVDARKEVLNPFFRSWPRKRSSSHHSKHLRALVVVRYLAVAGRKVRFTAVELD